MLMFALLALGRHTHTQTHTVSLQTTGVCEYLNVNKPKAVASTELIPKVFNAN